MQVILFKRKVTYTKDRETKNATNYLQINEKVYPNPKPGDTEPMYIAKRVRHSSLDNFDDKPLHGNTRKTEVTIKPLPEAHYRQINYR